MILLIAGYNDHAV